MLDPDTLPQAYVPSLDVTVIGAAAPLAAPIGAAAPLAELMG